MLRDVDGECARGLAVFQSLAFDSGMWLRASKPLWLAGKSEQVRTRRALGLLTVRRNDNTKCLGPFVLTGGH
jgi:hypothetical protein